MSNLKKTIHFVVVLLFCLSLPIVLMAENPGQRIDDPANDVSISHIDITNVSSSIEGEVLTAVICLKDIPEQLTFNRPGVPEDALEYGWTIQIDVDNNLKTGRFLGIDYELAALAFNPPSYVDKVENHVQPIENGVQVDTWVIADENATRFEDASIIVDAQSNTITLSGTIPGISLNSKIYVKTYDANPGGSIEEDNTESYPKNLILYSDFQNGQIPAYSDWGKDVKLSQPINTVIENGSLIVSPKQDVPEGRFSFGNGASTIEFDFNIKDVSFDTYNLDINLIHSSLQQISDSEIFSAITCRQYSADISNTCSIIFDVFSWDRKNDVFTHLYGKNLGTILYGNNYKALFEWKNNAISFYLDGKLLDQYILNLENLSPLENPYNIPGYFVADSDRNRIGNASFKLTIDNIYTDIDYNTQNSQYSYILTDIQPDLYITAGSNTNSIYGTTGANNITLENGAKAELLNFPGSNTITIQSDSSLFAVSRSGATVTFEGSDGTVLKIPSTTNTQTINFSDQTLTLTIYNNQVMLDDQVVTTTAASIGGGAEVVGECGAYIAPGVWKEFDCYNLAAIGKTTGDDPFTPSWRLIGGYWQWGRKGPNSSQWYDTNTSNFAHGPTGPGSSETNEDHIDKWDDSTASDGAWSDSVKTANDPCPSGYRVPTKIQWDGVVDNNTQSSVGTWSTDDDDHTNYSAGRFFGDDLMLPATGSYNGLVMARGNFGYYWSSTESSAGSCPVDSSCSVDLRFDSDSAYTLNTYRNSGLSVRCIEEDATQSDSVWYKDSDGDGYSDGESLNAYTRPGDDYYLSTELTATDGDYDDNDYDVHPGAEEICDNGIDDDCDGEIDEGCTAYSSECGAYIAPGVWKEFDCYNLAAIGKTTGDDPFTPSWRLIGGYWQWGRKGPDSSQWYDTNTSNFAHGPTGPDEADANSDAISGWDTSYASDGAWSDSVKTSNDPCPSGYRVPTKTQWYGVVDNNTRSSVGTWSTDYFDHINYSTGLFFGDNLMLPAAGYRIYNSGSLNYRGIGYYWSSTETSGSSRDAWYLYFDSSNANTYDNIRRNGFSLRCVEEDATQSDSVWYKDSDGDGYSDGESLNADTRPGDDYYLLTELTATDGDCDDNDYDVHPGAEENCDNGIDDDCDGEIDEDHTAYSGECGAYIAPGVWKEFDCYNLAAIGKTTNDDPFTPSWRLIGGYWQWGRKGPDSSQWYDTNTSNFAHGPTGPDEADANNGMINEWELSTAPDNAWSELIATDNDPCPSGYKTPTKSQWDGVIENNTISIVGPWSTGSTNYNSGKYFGDKLMLPATGDRAAANQDFSNRGILRRRGDEGIYWSSTISTNTLYAYTLYIYCYSQSHPDYDVDTGENLRDAGHSVRCIKAE